MSFPDGSYLELIALQPAADPEAVAAHYWSSFLNTDSEPCAWAVRVSDVAVEAERLSQRGVAVSPPAKSGRRRPDGVQLNWEAARVGPGPNGAFFPFLIRDLTPRETRVFPSGKPTTTEFNGIAKVVIAVEKMDESIRLYQRAHDLPVPTFQKDSELEAQLAWFEGTPVVLASPLPGSPLTARLRRFGTAPCALVLAAPKAAGSDWFGKRISWFDSATLGWHLGVEG